MTWPLPQPGDIASRAAGVYEAEYQRVYTLLNPGAEPVVVDARSNTSLLAIDCRVLDGAVSETYAYQARLAQELMPDTAVDWLPRHGAIWVGPSIAATAASGNGTAAGVESTSIPSGLALTAPSGAAYVTTASATITGGSATVPIAAVVAGTVGNLPAGTVLTIVNPVEGLSPQTITVAAGGLTGEDAETIDEYRARIIARIRQRGLGGNATDFENWTQEVLPGALVRAFSLGLGLISVAFAMPSGQTWRVPTSTELATVTAYLNDASKRKPLGAPVVEVVAATLQPVNYTIALNPDTTTTRTAATNALTLQMLADGAINGTIYMSRMDAALESASGEFSHERSAPSADVTPGTAISLPVIGTVTFT